MSYWVVIRNVPVHGIKSTSSHNLWLENKFFHREGIGHDVESGQLLEMNGDRMKRGEAKESSIMCGFGMRWARGDIGWYHHRKVDYLKLLEYFARFVASRLQNTFGRVFNYLDKIKETEGFKEGEACIGNSPFTTFTMTCDHNCRPHLDWDDYDLGFIIWLYEDDMLTLSLALTRSFYTLVISCQEATTLIVYSMFKAKCGRWTSQPFFVSGSAGDLLPMA